MVARITRFRNDTILKLLSWLLKHLQNLEYYIHFQSQLPSNPESTLPASPTPRDKVADLSLVMLLDCINDATIWPPILRAGLSISQASFAHCYDWSHLVEVGVLQAGALSCKRWENLQDIRSTDAK